MFQCTAHLGLASDDVLAELKSSCKTAPNFATNLMRFLYSREERVQDCNMSGYKKPPISPTAQRLNYIISCMVRQFGIQPDQIPAARAEAIKAMDDANRRDRPRLRMEILELQSS